MQEGFKSQTKSQAAIILEFDTIFEINNDNFSAKYSGSFLIIDFQYCIYAAKLARGCPNCMTQ